MDGFGTSTLFQCFRNILAKFNTFSRSWKAISQFNSFSIPRENPEKSIPSIYNTNHEMKIEGSGHIKKTTFNDVIKLEPSRAMTSQSAVLLSNVLLRVRVWQTPCPPNLVDSTGASARRTMTFNVIFFPVTWALVNLLLTYQSHPRQSEQLRNSGHVNFTTAFFSNTTSRTNKYGGAWCDNKLMCFGSHAWTTFRHCTCNNKSGKQSKNPSGIVSRFPSQTEVFKLFWQMAT